jgi:hypothetical protein
MLGCQFVLLGCLAVGKIATPPTPAALSKQILDDAQPAQKRQELAAHSADRAAEVVAAMVADLPATDVEEEYRRIPWIWRVSIAAGKRNEAMHLRALLATSLPQEGASLRDWQAVVIGGGIINGISLSGKWPKPRIEELLGEDEPLRRRWQQSLAAAAVMADSVKVKTGTRYDALRMIALDPTKEQLARLAKYLAKDADSELQMGAVSGLADVDAPEAAKLLSTALPVLTKANQGLAIDALLRSDARIEALLSLLESGKFATAAVSESQRQKLLELPPGKLRDRAEALLKRAE